MAFAGRCECYNNHNSSVGRCNTRYVTDPLAGPKDAVLCEWCRDNCVPSIRPKVATHGWTLTIYWSDDRESTSQHDTRAECETAANTVTKHGHPLIAGWRINPT